MAGWKDHFSRNWRLQDDCSTKLGRSLEWLQDDCSARRGCSLYSYEFRATRAKLLSSIIVLALDLIIACESQRRIELNIGVVLVDCFLF